jgi:multiple sugar transport system substrate-binding protein
MIARRFARLWLLAVLTGLVLISAGCDQIPIPGLGKRSDVTPTPSQPVFSPTAEITLTPTLNAPTQPGSTTLRVWLPPEFDPAAGSPAGDLLQKRLDEFQKRRPNVKIDTRIKAVEGTGGMINTLTTASVAAPLALPDLVALPRRSIETAVQKGLLYPFGNLGPLENAEWFDYAAELSGLEQGQYSLPFAGDALVLHYRPELVESPPETWEAILQTQAPLLFPAASPQALFTLAQYEASGGAIEDQDGRPFLDQTILTALYIFYQQASSGEQMPFWLTQYEDDDQVWQAYQEHQAPMVVNWLSRYLAPKPDDTAIGQLPTQDGTPYTLATGWVWASPNQDPTRRDLSTELAVFLSDAEFLSDWTLTAGYLPTRPDVLAGWDDVALQALASRVIAAAQPYPSPDLLNIIGPALQQTTIDVLKQQDTPAAAAERAAGEVNTP